MPKKPKGKKKLYLLILTSILALSLPVLAAEKHAVVFEYGYGSIQEIPGSAKTTHGPCLEAAHCERMTVHVGKGEESEEGSLGLSYLYFVKDDLSVHFRGWVPQGDPGADTVSGSLGLDYWFGHFYVPLSVGYWNDLDSLAFGGGVGLKLPIGKVSLQGDAGIFYLDDADLEDQTAWKATGGIGIGF